MVNLTKESKSAATIRRRRKKKSSSSDSGPSPRHKLHSVDEQYDFTEEDPEPPMESPDIQPQALRLILSSEKTLFLGLVAFRVLNAMMIQTAYVPDEYWQSLEVAHRMAFGYGHLTWEWRQGLRSYLYPSMFAVLYKVLGVLHLDSRTLLIKLPLLLQGVLSAVGDLYLYKFSCRLSGSHVGLWSLLCQVTSWFAFFCGPRTLGNSMETVLCTVALFYFPWPGKTRKAHWKYVSLVGLAVALRPTAAIVWLPLCVWHMWMYRQVAWRVGKIFAEKGFIIFSISSIIDRYFYGDWINVHYNFLEFNVFHNMGAFYGSHPWHWYLTQGFPVVLGAQIFPFLLGARKAVDRVLLAVIFWTIAVYSLLTHKEFRFLYPVLPMAMHICGKYLSSATGGDDTEVCDNSEEVCNNSEEVCDNTEEVCDNHEREDNAGEDTESMESEGSHESRMHRRRWCVVIFLIISNLPLAMYTSLLHQRGTIQVMKYLSDEVTQRDHVDFLFLMPCHSTPYYSHLHHNVSMRFLTCEPNLSHRPNYTDEADVFYEDPVKWLKAEYSSGKLPSHVILFDRLEEQVGWYLADHGYRECRKLFHTHIPEGRVGSHVIVWCVQRAQKHRVFRKSV